MTPAQEQKLLKVARERFQQSQDADAKQRLREKEDLGFFAGEMWDADMQAQRRGQNANAGLPPVPARPMLTINKVKEPVRQVLNQERGADMGVQLVPADDFGDLGETPDDTEVTLREGLMRRIQRNPEAADARTWAFTRAVIAGRGYYGVMTRFLPGKTWDQEPYVHRFYNQSSVSLDPAHEQPDGSDAEWGFIGNDLPWPQYEAEHPKVAGRTNQLLGIGDDEFRALCEDYPTWFTQDGDTRSGRVVDYFYTERTARTLVLLADGSSAWKDELQDGAQLVDERDVIEKKIKWAKIDGYQVLDETDWLGPDIPIVKVLGEELQPYDDQRRAEGMVRGSRDAQIGFNAMVSKWVESVGLAPIPPFQATMEQIEGYEQWYQLANTRTLPYLPYNAVSESGQPLGPPSRTDISTPITAIAASVQMFDEAIQATTGVPEARVGRNVDAHLKSGKALKELRESSEFGTSNYLDNLRRSIRYEGQILNNLFYPLYGKTPGRLVRIMNGEGENEVVQVNAPQPPPPQMPPGMIPPPAPPQEMAPGQPPQGMMPPAPPQKKAYKLTKDANFNVVVKVTRSYDSRRSEEAQIIADLLTTNPVFMTWFGDLFFKSQDGPGHVEMAERAKVMLDPKIQGMIESKSQPNQPPPQLMQQLQQMQEQLKMAEQALQTESQKANDKQAEHDAKITVAKLAADKDIRLQEMRDATAIAVAKIAAMAKGVTIAAEAENEALALGQEYMHDAISAQQMHDHDLESSQQAHSHAMEQSLMGAQTDSMLADQGHQQALAQAEQGAALQPLDETTESAEDTGQ